MKSIFSYLALILFFSIIHEVNTPVDYAISLDHEESEIGTEEDPQARFNYEYSMLADPSTGRIPANITFRERQFALTIPTKESYARSSGKRLAQNTYQKSGPFNVGGRTRAIAMDVRDENTLLAGGVSGGIWKTTNGGTKWTRTSDPTLRNSITCLAQDKREGHESNWYFATGELVGNSARSLVSPYRGVGVYKSTDDGDSWFLLESTIDNATPDHFTSQFQYAWRIITNRFNETEDEVLLAAYGGILRSLDGGNTWGVTLGSNLTNLTDINLNCSEAPFYTDIAQTSQGHIYAALSSANSATSSNCDGASLYSESGFFVSENGNDWVEITPPGFPNYHERSVITSSNDGSQVFFMTQSDRDVSLWRFEPQNISVNTATGKWTNLSANLPRFGGDYGDYNTQQGYNMVIGVHPDNEDVIYIGGTNLYRSTDGFRSEENTTWIGGYSTVNNASVYEGHYPDQHALLFYPSDANKMISTNDGGIRITNNNLRDTVSWRSLNNGYVTSQFYTIAQRQDASTTEIIGGMQDTGSHLKTARGENPPWVRILGGDGGYCAITPNSDFKYVSFQQGQVYRITLNANSEIRSFARVDPTDGGDYLFINPFVIDPANGNRMFLPAGNVIWKNENLAQIPAGIQKPTKVNWTRLRDTRISAGAYTSITKAKTADIVLAGVTEPNPYIVRMEGTNDTDKLEVDYLSRAQFPQAGHIACIAINPENDDHFVVVFSNYNSPSLFETTDQGATFTDISGNLEQYPDGRGDGPSVRWAEIMPTTTGYTIATGTSIGLYSTSETMGAETIWTRESEDMIGQSVVTAMDYRPLDGRLVIGTHGNGVFETYLEDARFIDPSENKPERLVAQAYPNPFTSTTTFEYTLPESGEVKIDLFDSGGRLIRNLLWAPQYSGTNQISWDGTNNAGVRVRPGVYILKLMHKGQQISRRAVMIQ